MATATLEKKPASRATSKKAPAKSGTRTRARAASSEKAKAQTKAPSKKTASSNKAAAQNPDCKQKSQGERNKELGRRGEEAAARFLVHRGYEILERNWECVAGEADIIARDERVVVFVEVKTRSDSTMGFPAEAVTAKKRQRYERIACLYLQEHELSDVLVRFDVISLVAVAPDRALIRHHINAWSEADK